MKLDHRVTLTILIMLFVLVWVSVSHAFFGSFGAYKEVKGENGEVAIPLAKINDGKAHYFFYEGQGKEVRFFVVKSPDGVIRAAFDACDVCYLAKKGYSQDGDFMVCNNCGRKFHATRINVVEGGCNPAPLHREVRGDMLVIKEADILPGGRFF